MTGEEDFVRCWRAIAGFVLLLAALAVTSVAGPAPAAQAAPLVAPITRVGPDDLAAAVIVDASADARWVLAGGFGTVQRIDRNTGNATAPLPAASLDLAINDDGTAIYGVTVDALGEVTVHRTNPVNGLTTEIIPGGLGPGSWSRVGNIALSSTGRYVAFTARNSSSASDTVVVADVQGPFSLVRADATLPAAPARRSSSPSISGDGRYVAFVTSTAPMGCVTGPGCGEVWVRDRVAGTNRLVTVRAAGGTSTGRATLAAISRNGRFVAFISDANDLVPGVTTRAPRLYVRDLATNRTVLAAGQPMDGPFGPRPPSVSDDGRLVAFAGRGSAMVGGSATPTAQVLVADLADGSVVQIPRRPNGNLPDSSSATPFLRADGTEVLFASSATDLVNPPSLGGWLLYAARIGGPGSSISGQTLDRARFVPMTPTRVLDTRTGLGGWPAGQRPFINTTVTFKVGGVAGVPANASAVVLNVTATDARDRGYVTVYPAGGVRPLASNLNIERPGQTIPNLVVVPLGANQSVSIYTQSGTHLVADVLGYFVPAQQSAAGRYRALTPGRVLDTRDGTGGWPAGVRPGPGATVRVMVRGQKGVPAEAAAVVLNVTATEARESGYVTVYPGGAPRPFASNLNVQRAGQTIANLVIVPLGADGSVSLFTHQGTHLVADVLGYFTNGMASTSSSGLFVPFRPVRLHDSRTPFPVPLADGVPSRYRVLVPPMPAGGVQAVLLNVTAVEPSDRTFLTVYPAGEPRPLASNLNVERAGQIIPNAVVATLEDGAFDVFAQRRTHIVIDAAGYFRA